MIFKVGGPDLKSKMACQRRPSRDAGGVSEGGCAPSEVGAFLKMWAQMKRFGALFFIMLNI